MKKSLCTSLLALLCCFGVLFGLTGCGVSADEMSLSVDAATYPLKKQIEELEAGVTAANGEIESLNEELSTANGEIENLNEELSHANGIISDTKEQLIHLEEQKEALSVEMTELRSDVAELENINSELENTNAELEDRINILETVKEEDIIDRNRDVEHIVHAASNYGKNGDKYEKCLAMLVSTDIHGDAGILENMITYLNGVDAIDAGICLGDIQPMTYGDNDGTWYTDIVNTSEKNFYTVLGNHDVGVWNGYEGNGTAELAFDKFIAPTEDKLGIPELTTPYYSVAFDSYDTVLVVLNTYDAPDMTDENGEFVISRNNELFSQEQIDWFIQTLADVPTGYHVVVAMHSVGFEYTIVDSNFTHNNDDYGLEMRYPYGWCTIIPDIVNAWKNGTALNESYEPIEYTDVLPTLTAACDFTARGKGEFACYLVGHDHTDKIMRCAKYEDQLIVSLVTSACSDYHVEHSDLPRMRGTKTEDALTVFCVDTKHRLIKLVRIGSNVTNELKDRTFTAIGY